MSTSALPFDDSEVFIEDRTPLRLGDAERIAHEYRQNAGSSLNAALSDAGADDPLPDEFGGSGLEEGFTGYPYAPVTDVGEAAVTIEVLPPPLPARAMSHAVDFPSDRDDAVSAGMAGELPAEPGVASAAAAERGIVVERLPDDLPVSDAPVVGETGAVGTSLAELERTVQSAQRPIADTDTVPALEPAVMLAVSEAAAPGALETGDDEFAPQPEETLAVQVAVPPPGTIPGAPAESAIDEDDQGRTDIESMDEEAMNVAARTRAAASAAENLKQLMERQASMTPLSLTARLKQEADAAAASAAQETAPPIGPSLAIPLPVAATASGMVATPVVAAAMRSAPDVATPIAGAEPPAPVVPPPLVGLGAAAVIPPPHMPAPPPALPPALPSTAAAPARAHLMPQEPEDESEGDASMSPHVRSMPLQAPRRLDVRGFLAGFALSGAFGIVLYLFMTAG